MWRVKQGPYMDQYSNHQYWSPDPKRCFILAEFGNEIQKKLHCYVVWILVSENLCQ